MLSRIPAERRTSLDMDADGLPPSRRRWAILAVSIGLVMAVLNTAISNIALPTIAEDLRASAAASVWVVNAFQLAVTVSLLPLSSLGDIAGHRRVYLVGLAVFTLASLACGMSDSLEMLVAARVLQGLGAAGVMSVNTALIRFIYPRAMLGRGIGLNVLLVATASAAGPSVAAAILAVAPWQWLFIVNAPLGVLAFGPALYALPRTQRSGHRFDPVSAFLSAITFGLLIAGIDAIGHGHGIAPVAAALGIAAVAGIALVRRQASSAMPLLPVDLFRMPVFSLSAATAVCSFAAQGIAFVALPFYFYDVIGRTQVETGLLMTPWPLTVAVIAPVVGRLADRYSAGVLGTAGLLWLSAGLVLIALLPADPGTADIVWRMSICGLGFGLFQATNSRTIISSAPRERSGAASGIISTSRLLGQATGAALVAVIFGLTAGSDGAATGTTIAALTAAGFAAVGAAASGMRLVDFRRPGTGPHRPPAGDRSDGPARGAARTGRSRR